MALQAGILQEKVVIEAPTEARNAFGETTLTWGTFATRWAHIEATGYSEQARRQQIGGMVSHVVRMRYVPGMTGKMRLRWTSRGDRLLYISSVVEKGRREEHECQCEEQAT